MSVALNNAVVSCVTHFAKQLNGQVGKVPIYYTAHTVPVGFLLACPGLLAVGTWRGYAGWPPLVLMMQTRLTLGDFTTRLLCGLRRHFKSSCGDTAPETRGVVDEGGWIAAGTARVRLWLIVRSTTSPAT